MLHNLLTGVWLMFKFMVLDIQRNFGIFHSQYGIYKYLRGYIKECGYRDRHVYDVCAPTVPLEAP